jgi:hypothetical protein
MNIVKYFVEGFVEQLGMPFILLVSGFLLLCIIAMSLLSFFFFGTDMKLYGYLIGFQKKCAYLDGKPLSHELISKVPAARFYIVKPLDIDSDTLKPEYLDFYSNTTWEVIKGNHPTGPGRVKYIMKAYIGGTENSDYQLRCDISVDYATPDKLMRTRSYVFVD